MGTSVVFEWRRNCNQLQGSSLPLTCCKQYAANIKALLTWNGLALSLELVAQKGEEILGMLLSYTMHTNWLAQAHWSLLESQTCKDFIKS